jgi:hypothetical protein
VLVRPPEGIRSAVEDVAERERAAFRLEVLTSGGRDLLPGEFDPGGQSFGIRRSERCADFFPQDARGCKEQPRDGVLAFEGSNL